MTELGKQAGCRGTGWAPACNSVEALGRLWSRCQFSSCTAQWKDLRAVRVPSVCKELRRGPGLQQALCLSYYERLKKESCQRLSQRRNNDREREERRRGEAGGGAEVSSPREHPKGGHGGFCWVTGPNTHGYAPGYEPTTGTTCSTGVCFSHWEDWPGCSREHFQPQKIGAVFLESECDSLQSYIIPFQNYNIFHVTASPPRRTHLLTLAVKGRYLLES